MLLRGLFYTVLTVLPLLVSCSADTFNPTASDDNLILETLRKRAEQMAELQWVPLSEMPTQGGYYQEGRIVKGIPYSSVKEQEKFVGQYVSFYTFMTAVANPKSVLYTDNVKNPPYHGTNCSTYYGTVCSMSVNYVLGIPYSYTTALYKHLDCFSLVNPQSINAAEPGDILLKDSKHVVMILDIIRTANDISSVSVFESSGGDGTRIQKYTKEQLLDRWQRDGWELLRYSCLDELPELEVMAFNDYPFDTLFTSPMCCSRGDRATFREGEEIVLNNLDGRHHDIRIVKDNQVIEQKDSDGSDISFTNLSPGIYYFDLSNSSWNNPSIEVLETSVSAVRLGDELAISFSSINACPMSVIISNLSGNHYLVQPITAAEREVGRMTVKIPNRSEQMYLKVMFEGAYGCAMNDPIAL